MRFQFFVEDIVGKSFIENTISQPIRKRIKIIPVGSDQAVLKHMAVHYRENDKKFIAFLDGDKRSIKKDSIGKIRNHLESRLPCSNEVFYSQMDARLNYLPGTSWPEKMLIESALQQNDLSALGDFWQMSCGDIRDAFNEALTVESHKEFFTVAKNLGLEEGQVKSDIIRFYRQNNGTEVQNMENAIKAILNENTTQS